LTNKLLSCMIFAQLNMESWEAEKCEIPSSTASLLADACCPVSFGRSGRESNGPDCESLDPSKAKGPFRESGLVLPAFRAIVRNKPTWRGLLGGAEDPSVRNKANWPVIR
jgi:hypothetical protein